MKISFKNAVWLLIGALVMTAGNKVNGFFILGAIINIYTLSRILELDTQKYIFRFIKFLLP